MHNIASFCRILLKDVNWRQVPKDCHVFGKEEVQYLGYDNTLFNCVNKRKRITKGQSRDTQSKAKHKDN